MKMKKLRGITDAQLNGVLIHHAGTLKGVVAATTVLLRERRLWLVWKLVVTGVLGWLVLVQQGVL